MCLAIEQRLLFQNFIAKPDLGREFLTTQNNRAEHVVKGFCIARTDIGQASAEMILEPASDVIIVSPWAFPRGVGRGVQQQPCVFNSSRSQNNVAAANDTLSSCLIHDVNSGQATAFRFEARCRAIRHHQQVGIRFNLCFKMRRNIRDLQPTSDEDFDSIRKFRRSFSNAGPYSIVVLPLSFDTQSLVSSRVIRCEFAIRQWPARLRQPVSTLKVYRHELNKLTAPQICGSSQRNAASDSNPIMLSPHNFIRGGGKVIDDARTGLEQHDLSSSTSQLNRKVHSYRASPDNDDAVRGDCVLIQ